MDVKEFEVYESNQIGKNACAVAEELDDAPRLGEYIMVFLTEKSNEWGLSGKVYGSFGGKT